MCRESRTDLRVGANAALRPSFLAFLVQYLDPPREKYGSRDAQSKLSNKFHYTFGLNFSDVLPIGNIFPYTATSNPTSYSIYPLLFYRLPTFHDSRISWIRLRNFGHQLRASRVLNFLYFSKYDEIDWVRKKKKNLNLLIPLIVDLLPPPFFLILE